MILIGKNINYIYEEEKEEIYVYGDYDRLKQVFINLIKTGLFEASASKTTIPSVSSFDKNKKQSQALYAPLIISPDIYPGIITLLGLFLIAFNTFLCVAVIA